jgi:hypothetical protein
MFVAKVLGKSCIEVVDLEIHKGNTIERFTEESAVYYYLSCS